MKLFDAHCHLQDERLLPEIGATMQRAAAAGVERMLCCGSGENDWAQVADLAANYPQIIPSFGLHPWCVRGRSKGWLDALALRLKEHPDAAVGEIGLDHALKERDDQEQESVFLEQVRLAKETQRPVTIHCRRAWGRIMELIGELSALPRGFLIHSYSGSRELVEPLTGAGAWFSFSGSITFHRNARGHEAVRNTPAERLLIETDAPDFMPLIEGASGAARVNEPANLPYVLWKVAELRGVAADAMAEQLWRNAARFTGAA